MKKSMIVSLSVIFVALLGLAQVTFAIWDSLQRSKDRDISIGEGVTLSVDETVTVPEGKKLVPVTAIKGTDDISEIVLEYTCTLDKETISPLALAVTIGNVTIGGSGEYADLVIIDINPETDMISTEPVRVIVTVSLDEPETEEAYHAIKNKTISFTLNFTALKNG